MSDVCAGVASGCVSSQCEAVASVLAIFAEFLQLFAVAATANAYQSRLLTEPVDADIW